MSTRPPGTSAQVGTKCWDSGIPLRSASGSAYQSWTPWSCSVASEENSEWEMPEPAIMRLTSPGRTMLEKPVESMCSISPWNSRVTVASPVCGWRATCMPPVAATSSGPKWSTKHQGPMSERLRWGRVRRTVIARSPPSGTSRAVMMSMASAQVTCAHSYSAGSIS